MGEELENALQCFTQDPSRQGRVLRQLLQQDRKEFSRHALQSLQKGGDTAGHKYLITLLLQNGFLVEDLYDPEVFTKELSIGLALRIARIEPQFDSMLARLLPGRDGGSPAVEGKVAERVLDLLEATSTGARIVPLIAHLTRHSDIRLRSKAVLLIGQRLQNARATEALLNEPDTRVRASAVEALWEAVDSPSIRAVLWQALKDPANRVAGNAIYGLYCLRQQEVIPHLLKMGADGRPLHRSTAAWVMGMTGDPRFLPSLERLSCDLYAVARRQATAAVSRIREAEEAGARLPPLAVTVLRAENLPDGSRIAWLRVEKPGGGFLSGLGPTEVILLEDGKLVLDYQISEAPASRCLSVGFALCSEAGISNAWVDAAGQAVTGCLPHKRSGDYWAVCKLRPDDRPVRLVSENDEPVAPASYHLNKEAVELAIGAEATPTGASHAALQAARMLLPGAAVVQGRRHVIVLAGQELAGARDMNVAMRTAIENKVAIHALVPGEPQAALAALCRRTGGGVVVAPTPEDLAQAYMQIYLGLLDRYEIRYRAPASSESSAPGSIGLRVFSSQGCGEGRLNPS
jgi:hypothetical protein